MVSISCRPYNLKWDDYNGQFQIQVLAFEPVANEFILLKIIDAHCYFIIETPDEVQESLIDKLFTMLPEALYLETHKHETNSYVQVYFNSLATLNKCKVLNTKEFVDLKIHGGTQPYTDHTLENFLSEMYNVVWICQAELVNLGNKVITWSPTLNISINKTYHVTLSDFDNRIVSDL